MPEDLNDIAGNNPIDISGDPVIQTEVDMLCLLADFPEKLTEVRSILSPDMVSNSKVGQLIKNFIEQNIIPTHSIVEEIVNDPVYQIRRNFFKITDVEYVLQSLLHNYKFRYLTYKLPNKLLHSDYSKAISEIEKAQEISTYGTISKKMFDLDRLFNDAMKFQTSTSQIYQTGIGSIDKQMIPRIVLSDLIILAADTGVGKTLITLQMVENISTLYDESIAWFSLEMTALKMTNRRIALYLDKYSAASITDKTIFSQFDGELDYQNAAMIARRKKIFINDEVYMFNDICNHIRNLAKQGIKIFVIDYLQLIRHHNERLDEVRQLQHIIITLKLLCNHHNIIIFALSQFHRKDDFKMSNNGKTIKREPEVSDLKGASSLEQNSDRIFMLWCDPEEMSSPKEERYIKFLVKKNRDGRQFSTWVMHHKRTGQITSVDDATISMLNTANAENNKGEKDYELKLRNRN